VSDSLQLRPPYPVQHWRCAITAAAILLAFAWGRRGTVGGTRDADDRAAHTRFGLTELGFQLSCHARSTCRVDEIALPDQNSRMRPGVWWQLSISTASMRP